MKLLGIIFSIIIAIFLIFSLMIFIPSHAISSNISAGKINSFIDGFTESINLEPIYQAALADCAEKANVSLEYEEYGSIELECSSLIDRESFDDLLKEKIKEAANNKLVLNSVYGSLFMLKVVMWISLVLSVIFITLIVLFSGFKSNLILGISGIVAGIPVFFVEEFRRISNRILEGLGLYSTGEAINLIQIEFVNGIVSTLYKDFMFSFVIGIILVIIGFLWIMVKKKNDRQIKSKTKKKE